MYQIQTTTFLSALWLAKHALSYFAFLTKAAVAQVLSEADVAQLAGNDPAHLQSHGRALALHLHAHTHWLHLQHQHRHLQARTNTT